MQSNSSFSNLLKRFFACMQQLSLASCHLASILAICDESISLSSTTRTFFVFFLVEAEEYHQTIHSVIHFPVVLSRKLLAPRFNASDRFSSPEIR